MSLESVLAGLVGDDAPLRVESYDGTRFGPEGAPASLIIRGPDALRHLVRAPNELGLVRAYVSGSVDFDGDLWTILALRNRRPTMKLTPRQVAELVRLVGLRSWRHPPARPAEEFVPGTRWRSHSMRRDRMAINHHYDVGNDFYRLVLGPSLVYSCGLFTSPDEPLEQAQTNKMELICRKLDLREGRRFLDIGCGWGSLVLHAAAHHGVHAVGITISQQQAELAQRRVIEAGLGGRVEIRLQDYRDLADGPYDAIASVGMVEHVGKAHLRTYLDTLAGLLSPTGRLLNQQIARPAAPWDKQRGERTTLDRGGFMNRYVFPDGELFDVGSVIEAMHRTGLEVRHVESLREHYALTLRHWLANLETSWDEAVALVGDGRARVWRLYMAATALMFEQGEAQVHQVLAVRSTSAGDSGFPLRPALDTGAEKSAQLLGRTAAQNRLDGYLLTPSLVPPLSGELPRR